MSEITAPTTGVSNLCEFILRGKGGVKQKIEVGFTNKFAGGDGEKGERGSCRIGRGSRLYAVGFKLYIGDQHWR